MSKKEISIIFGALADSLIKQLVLQDIPVPADIGKYDQAAKSLISLKLMRILTDSQVHQARQKLLKSLIKAVAQKDRANR